MESVFSAGKKGNPCWNPGSRMNDLDLFVQELNPFVGVF